MKVQEKFHPANGKRLILIADDEMINREILREMLQDEYELIFAENGEETLEKMRQNRDILSLVLLDILMPILSGLDVLRAVREDDSLSRIPIIVMTAERETEIESLKLGAIDFIPKPYPSVGVIQARLLRTIELSEDREIIQSTERDELTGLFNREFFYKYAEQYDQHHKGTDMDAVIMDINHFRMINERYGRAAGDDVIRRISNVLRKNVNAAGGIVCRRQADTFMIYCPHREDYTELMEEASVVIRENDEEENRIRLRLGVYENADKSLEIERRFDRAKMAADNVRGIFTKAVGYYDSELHDKELYAERLVEDFPKAISDNQFRVFYQPKFDVKPDVPILASAEALVRWEHPELGMVSPGIFIPLFEKNGLVEKVDKYVWRETARQIREWKDRLGFSIPVSVNVSRIDLYDPALPDTIGGILSEFGLTGKDLLLEITESAYTQDSAQIIETVEKLRAMDLQIEMDDFGTGYSSLNMISNLPIDALKLDMGFIRNAFREGGNTHMLEVIISIAEYLSVPVIAEGVETQEQLRALRTLGCGIVQGYFFSKPVPPADFEPFILQRKEHDHTEAIAEAKRLAEEEKNVEKRIIELRKDAAKKEEEPVAEPEPEEVPEKERRGIKLRTMSIISVVLAFLAALALFVADLMVMSGYRRMEVASDRYSSCQLAATEMESGSDYLTDRVRCFIVTGELTYLNDFYEEIEVTRRRDKAVESLEVLLADEEKSALESLNTALDLSNELVAVEKRAMRLMVEAGNYDLEQIPDDVLATSLTDEERALSDEEKREKAESLVFDDNYMYYKNRIWENVSLCTQELIRSAGQELNLASSRLSLLVQIQTVITIIFFLIVLVIVVVITRMVRKPLTQMVDRMQKQEKVPIRGVEELQVVTQIYNRILEENNKAKEKLSHEASHDALTGLFNRGAYDLLMDSADKEHMALILIDVDSFKEVNDNYGHAVGDRILKRVADILRHSFRSVDILCRIGGDEFAVVMTRVNSSMRQLVHNKILQANELLQHPKDDLPPVTLSVGVAFSDRENPEGDIFRDADTALYRVKESGRNGCSFF